MLDGVPPDLFRPEPPAARRVSVFFLEISLHQNELFATLNCFSV